MVYFELSLLLPSPGLQTSFIFQWELRSLGQCQASRTGSANLWLGCAILAQPTWLILAEPRRARVGQLWLRTGQRSSPELRV